MSYRLGTGEPFEFVDSGVDSQEVLPPLHRVVVHTVHDGDLVPSKLLESDRFRLLHESGALEAHFVRARDWGADLVAHHLSRALGLAGHARVRIARVIMDFNRFPGQTQPESDHLESMALNEPVASSLDHETKRHVLEDGYDEISRGMELLIAQDPLMFLAIHTYDEHNVSRTRRPEVSILSRSHSYQKSSRLPYGLFDPAFPDILVESTSKRILRDRIAITLEKAGIDVEHNYPYCLPDGSLEIRAQPWQFFSHLRRQFEAAYPESRSNEDFGKVWSMMQNTNLRSFEAEALFGHLHRFRRAPAGRELEFKRARFAYDEVLRFLERHEEMIEAYRNSPDRLSALSVEVRKDLVWKFAGGRPIAPNEEGAKEIGGLLATALHTYVTEDWPGLKTTT